jgi:hypothetical protein
LHGSSCEASRGYSSSTSAQQPARGSGGNGRHDQEQPDLRQRLAADEHGGELGERTGAALQAAQAAGNPAVGMDEQARFLWSSVYPELSRGGTGLLDHVTARAEAQSVRLALLYALLDQAAEIRLPHLEAGLAVWHYCAASARVIFGDLLGEPAADCIMRALRQVAPAGLTRTDINNLFGRHLAAVHIDRAARVPPPASLEVDGAR